MILFVFEGAEREPRVFRTLERLFFGQGERIVCSFGKYPCLHKNLLSTYYLYLKEGYR